MCEEGTLQYSPSSELCAKTKLTIGKESNEQQREKNTKVEGERQKNRVQYRERRIELPRGERQGGDGERERVKLTALVPVPI